ncbi:MAG: class I SAM-dependent methyltransferase [Treponema sp.]|nr:class I SAM-dependent methyltransferase [Treponema sp.]
MSEKTVWNFFAPVYEAVMKSQKNIYDYLYENISAAASGKDVLELATGPGMIAKHIASSAKSVVATDFAPNMIEAAKKGACPSNVTFEVADATDLSYADKSFDLLVIANALHIMPEPEKAMEQINRVLKDDGILIAPNFIFREDGKKNLWQKILSLGGIKFAHEWTSKQFLAFVEGHGWKLSKSHVIPGRIDLLYAEFARA